MGEPLRLLIVYTTPKWTRDFEIKPTVLPREEVKVPSPVGQPKETPTKEDDDDYITVYRALRGNDIRKKEAQELNIMRPF